MTSPSKIGRLPRALQKELNRRLLRGDSSTPILEWLNPLPEVQAIMQADFAGAPINKQNLCDWRATGLVKWETRQEALTEILDFDGDAGELDTATSGRLAERLATNLAGRYARLLHHWDGEVTDEFTKKILGLRSLAQDVSHLRRWDHSAARVRLEQARIESSQEPDNEALFMKFEEWALNIGVQEYLTAYYESERDRDQARRKLLHLPPLPEDAAKPAPGVGTVCPHHPATTACAPSDRHPPQTPDARPQTQPMPPPSSTPSPEANSAPKPLQPLANSSAAPPVSVNPCQPPAPGARLSQPQPVTAPATPDHQPPSDRPSVPLSAMPVNGGEGRGENVPSPSAAASACAPPDRNPPQTPDARPQTPIPVPSPCIGVCKFNNGGYCTGCFRNTVEKVRWPTMAESEKAFVVATCARRKANPHFGGGK